MGPSDFKAPISDLLSTVLDWRTSIVRQGQQFGKARAIRGEGRGGGLDASRLTP